MYRYPVLFLILLMPVPSYSQEKRDSLTNKKFHLGIRAGVHYSFIKSEGGGPHSDQVTLYLDKPSKAGFNVSFFPDWKPKGVFSIQPELGYYYARREAELTEFKWTSQPPNYRSLTHSTVKMSSAIRLAALCKISTGSSKNLNILLGPDIRLPVFSSMGKTAAGMMAGVRVDLRDEKNSHWSFELRAGADISDMLDQIFLLCRERFIGLGIVYIPQ